MEGTGLVAQGDEDTNVNVDAESWSRLEPGICDLIWEKLPYMERLRLRIVCKDWNRSALESALEREERKPYFLTIVKREYHPEREYIGLIEYNVVSKSLITKPLVPIDLYPLSPFFCTMDGLIFCDHIENEDEYEWCVYNIHTRTKHVVPPAPGIMKFISGMVVDASVKPFTFKLVASSRSGGKTQIYHSGSRSWSLHPNPNPHSNSSLLLPRNDDLCLSLCHKGSMYMSTEKAREGVLVYSIEEDQWTTWSGFPFLGEDRPFLGVYDDRIFAVVPDFEIGSVFVWELIDETQQKWVQYARSPEAQYEHLIGHASEYFLDYKCEFVSVFCEEYVLMQNWRAWLGYALVLLHLKTREWESYPVVEAEPLRNIMVTMIGEEF